MSTDPSWHEAVLDFWFRELDRKAWFERSDAIDALIRTRFLDAHERAARSADKLLSGSAGPDDPRRLLAAVIALDQFPRNMFRGLPRAFATDPQALALAKAAVARGLDRDMGKDERLFLYLPYEHSESRDDQRQSVKLVAGLDDADLLRYAEAHKVIIDRFGRFPHRNAILGRPSTPEEEAFLKQPNSSF